MKYRKILITGGAGFVGSNLCLKLKKDYPKTKIIALDNLSRKGSILNVPRLKKEDIDFIKGDVRNKTDLKLKGIDLIIECSAEPSVMAGINSSPEYLLDTNLMGAINCFELARINKSAVIFLSTSRVYPISYINSIKIKEEKTRFSIWGKQSLKGVSQEGINENFPLDSPRSLYGATKLAAEYILLEYIDNYELKGVINRCGLLTGPWQMGKIDQGIIVYWLAAHVFRKNLSYFGFGGEGKQVRDILHIDDLYALIKTQIENIDKFNGGIYNVGGGIKNSISLNELTNYCQKITGQKITISKVLKNRTADIKLYISDNCKIIKQANWRPVKNIPETLDDIYQWIIKNKKTLSPIFS